MLGITKSRRSAHFFLIERVIKKFVKIRKYSGPRLPFCQYHIPLEINCNHEVAQKLRKDSIFLAFFPSDPQKKWKISQNTPIWLFTLLMEMTIFLPQMQR